MVEPLSEETKTRISELYTNSDQSIGVIAQALGVSERTVRRYKNYNGLGRPSPVASPHGQALEEQGRPSQNESGQALDITEKSSPDYEIENVKEPEESSESNKLVFVGGKKHIESEEELEEEEEKDQFQCGNCGYIQDTIFSKCPKCYYDMEWNEESKSEKLEEKDKYQCYNCDYIQGSPFSDCPKCGVSDTFEE